MYIDSLTITAIVIFLIFFGLFIKQCFLNICGLPSESKDKYKEDVEREDHS